MFNLSISHLEQIYSFIAVACYAISAIRIICFDGSIYSHKFMHKSLSFALIVGFLCMGINILYLKDPVTFWDAFFALFLVILICRSKGNIAKLIWSTT